MRWALVVSLMMVSSQVLLAQEASKDAEAKEAIVTVHVKVIGYEHAKAQAVSVDVDGFDAETLRISGLGLALSEAAADAANHETLAMMERRKNSHVSGVKHFRFQLTDGNEVLDRAIHKLREAGIVHMLADSTLITGSGKAATLSFVGEVPVARLKEKEGSSTLFRKIGTELKILPTVVSHDQLRVEIRQQVSSLVQGQRPADGVEPPLIRVLAVDTAFEMKPGQTLVLSGMPPGPITRDDGLSAGADEVVVLVRVESTEAIDVAQFKSTTER